MPCIRDSRNPSGLLWILTSLVFHQSALELRFLPPTWSVQTKGSPVNCRRTASSQGQGVSPGSSPPCWAPGPGVLRDTHRNEGCRQQSLPFISQSHFKSWLFDRPKDATHIYLVTNCFLKSLHLHHGFWCKRPFVAQHCQTELFIVKLLSLTTAWQMLDGDRTLSGQKDVYLIWPPYCK